MTVRRPLRALAVRRLAVHCPVPEGALKPCAFQGEAGGVDGTNTYAPQLFPSVTTALTLKRYSQASATYIVEHELGNEEGLLNRITLTDTPEDEAFLLQLEELRLRLHGREATNEWRTGIIELWKEAESFENAKLGWIAVLSAMFQDLDFVSY